ncbi:hypothetical protein [Methylobacterium trifolii]|uniref:Uncharacterized protein n=1 Tax=Methylobacterium trifolii TaxID=1003092 RepID=A0ABQ4TUD7_9HYPH|nr:hypothetical protein [Methylobacterium trifolii]GJE58054.1 hypothetical protein MPOCJGCO_0132 [Methylobacterium trifolii]
MAYVSATVMEEGKAARTKGEPVEANPYPAGSQDSADWLEGYTFDLGEQNVDAPDENG